MSKFLQFVFKKVIFAHLVACMTSKWEVASSKPGSAVCRMVWVTLVQLPNWKHTLHFVFNIVFSIYFIVFILCFIYVYVLLIILFYLYMYIV